MTALIARSKHWNRCSFGCCDCYRTKKQDRRIGKRIIKAIEKNEWQDELITELEDTDV